MGRLPVNKNQRAIAGLVRIGTSSFSEPDWVGTFYPQGTKPGDFLTHYARRFTTVEVDATYYAIPSKRTVDNWVERTPDGFVIAAKFPRSIVHGGDGPQPQPAIILDPIATYEARDRFLEVMSRLGNRLGPLLLQFPYFSRKTFTSPDLFIERLDRFLTDLPPQFQYAVEIRNRTWLTDRFVDLLRRHRISLVLVDHAWMPHGDEMAQMINPVTTDFVYLRLIGDRKEIEAITTSWDKEVIDRRERLERWAELVARFIEQRVRTLIYVNNHYAGHAPTTAARLEEMILQRIHP